MAPKPKANAEGKQKSLMTWFAKGPSATPKLKSTKPVAVPYDNASSSQASSQEPRTPASKEGTSSPLKASAKSSTSSRGHSTPPTSDPIDIDMLSPDDDAPVQKMAQRKRKVLLSDSDEDVPPVKVRKSVQPSSSPVAQVAKKQRISKDMTDDDEDEEETNAKRSFSQRLTNFKKSPVKRGNNHLNHSTSSLNLVTARKSRSNASDDDDFIAPSDSDGDSKSIKSSGSRSSASSRHSAASSEDEFSNDENRVKSKFKSKSFSKKNQPVQKGAAAPADTTSTGAGLFLTAAERREQGKKNDKKAAEDPYSFLAEIKDVRALKLLFAQARANAQLRL
ncbi:hypothetical protein H0H81_002622 [Sphagnurus paluster]|uniref:Uncharacterized protein n=1 Tax=Sphagnurus paluster TaxID=117069 RepID=A0A9P7KL84_9AGAR|nr:hypothetical protein H0H81_002622 [Sphagnurus paluster]